MKTSPFGQNGFEANGLVSKQIGLPVWIKRTIIHVWTAPGDTKVCKWNQSGRDKIQPGLRVLLSHVSLVLY